MRRWPDGCVDACITDPPYNMSREKGLGWAFSSHVTMQERWDRFSPDGYLDFTCAWLEQVCRLVKPNGNILIFGSFHNIYTIGFVLQAELARRVLQQITWFKPNAQPNITGRLTTESTEYVLWACNNTPQKAARWTFNYEAAKQINGGKQLRNLWTIPLHAQVGARDGRSSGAKANRAGRANRKALDQSRRSRARLLPRHGHDCDRMRAARRRWVGIEKDPEYAGIARKRLGAENAERQPSLRPYHWPLAESALSIAEQKDWNDKLPTYRWSPIMKVGVPLHPQPSAFRDVGLDPIPVASRVVARIKARRSRPRRSATP